MMSKITVRAVMVFLISLSFLGCNLFPKEAPSSIGVEGTIERQNSPDAQVGESNVTQGVEDDLFGYIDDWRRMKPSIERLIAIEGELKELIVQLNQMAQNQKLTSTSSEGEGKEISNTSEAPEPEIGNTSFVETESYDSVENADVVISATERPITYETESPSVSDQVEQIDGKFGVQLFSLSEKSAMRSTWNIYADKYSSVLAGMKPIYEEVLVGGKAFYRVKVGAINTQREAIQLCNSLRNLNASCFPSTSTGIAL